MGVSRVTFLSSWDMVALAGFQADPVYRHGRTACRSILPYPKILVSRYSVFEGYFSLSPPSFSPFILWVTMYRLRLARSRPLHTREPRCYHVCPNNSARIHLIHSSMFPAGRNAVGEKRSLGLRYLLIAVTSAPNCTPKPESPPSLSLSRTFPLISLSFLPPVPGPRRSRSRLSSRRILHPTDHSYESYLVASSTSPGSYEIAEASVVDASEY